MPESNKELFLIWLMQWHQQVESSGFKTHQTYKKAHDSLKTCSFEFQHPRDLISLKNFGPKTCEKLEKKLREYCVAEGIPMPVAGDKAMAAKRLQDQPAEAQGCATKRPLDENAPSSTKTKARKTKQYVPAYRTGAYAILLVLNRHRTNPIRAETALSREQIVPLAQEYCDTSFETPTSHNVEQTVGGATAGRYTAWAGVKMLLKHELVLQSGKRGRYAYEITEAGIEIAECLEEQTQALKTGSARAKTSAATGSVSSQPLREKSSLDMTATVPPTRKESSVLPASMFAISRGHIQQVTSETVRASVPDPGNALAAEINRQLLGFQSTQSSQNPSRLAELLSPPRKTATERRELSCDWQTITTVEPAAPKEAPKPKQKSITKAQSVINTKSHRYMHSPPLRATSLSQSAHFASTIATTARADVFQIPAFTPEIWPAGSYDISIVVDIREIQSQKDRDFFSNRLNSKHGVTAVVRALGLGDSLWIATNKNSGEEIVLDFITERKNLTDLVQSIQDGRFQEQKFRLARSALRNVVYIIEESPGADIGDFFDAVQTAISQTQVVNKYYLYRTDDVEGTADLLERLTHQIKELYATKNLYVIGDDIVDNKNYLRLMKHLQATDPNTSYHVSYAKFQKVSSKSGNLNVRDVFLRMLVTIRGLTWENALVIQRIFPTPRHLWLALCKEFSENGEAAARELVMKSCFRGVAFGTRNIGKVLSSRIAEVWGPVPVKNS
ncbi:uncharacterized protein V1518DRAFT_432051 [Limtongia smithiae]|uniref:uncharacterized protein n=1 Tax=Limtongia smithiae TaxID=1125753 RepID=UPI0034CF693E